MLFLLSHFSLSLSKEMGEGGDFLTGSMWISRIAVCESEWSGAFVGPLHVAFLQTGDFLFSPNTIYLQCIQI